MTPQRQSEITPEQEKQLIEKAKMSVFFNYERITGQNLQGIYPDRSIWNSLDYQKAAHIAIRNAEHWNRPLVAATIRKHLLK
jgi:hypothetical protein